MGRNSRRGLLIRRCSSFAAEERPHTIVPAVTLVDSSWKRPHYIRASALTPEILHHNDTGVVEFWNNDLVPSLPAEGGSRKGPVRFINEELLSIKFASISLKSG